MSLEICFEKNQRLSKSIIWELQRTAYTQLGPRAWYDANVPFYITSNPLAARQFAQVIVAFLKNSPSSDLPFYILDLGAGAGRFAYCFLKEIMPMLQNLKLGNKICYVMTDIVPENIQFWREHAYFQPFLEKKTLDFAYYNHEDSEVRLDLIESGISLSPETVTNPLTIIANYFFDTIPHDLFCVKNHQLFEGKVSLFCDKTAETEGLTINNPSLIPHLYQKQEAVPLNNIDDYAIDSASKMILKSYAKGHENIPYFLFPTGAIQVISHFRKLSQDKVIFLTADQGVVSTSQLMEEAPYFAKHGTYSMLVNYNALDAYFKHVKGSCKFAASSNTNLVYMAASPSLEEAGLSELCEAFRLTFGSFNSLEYHMLVDEASKKWSEPSFQFILSLLKLGNWDPINFGLFSPHLMKYLPKASLKEEEDLVLAIENCWKAFFPIHKEEGAFVMNFGVFLFAMKRYEEAVKYFQYAWNMGFEKALLCINMSLAYEALKDPDNARKWRFKGWGLHLGDSQNSC